MHAADNTYVEPAHRRAESGMIIPRESLTFRVLRSWFDIKGSVRSLIIQKPSEFYLFLLVLGSDMAFFLSWTMKAVIVPNETGVALISIEVGGVFVAAFVLRTAIMYVFAMVVGAVCRLFGGRGTWHNTRVAIFWGAFVTAPFGVAAAILSVLFTYLALWFPIFNANWISLPPYYLGLLPFVWFISAGVAKVHGFRKTSPIFLAISVVSLVGLVGAMYFYARGMI